MLSIIERIQAKLELLRLEKRYTRDRRRRSTFVSNAIYVDGEYVYQTPVSTGSSSSASARSCASPAINALHHEEPTAAAAAPVEFATHAPADEAVGKRDKKKRFSTSAVPTFGASIDKSWR
jgi:hypothetical protein